jgi:membrane protease YdiL (CAAX protease family)
MEWGPPPAVPPSDEARGGLRLTRRRGLAVRQRAWLGTPVVLTFVAGLIAVEAALLAPGRVLAADIVYAVLVFVLLNAATLALRSESPEARATSWSLQALALVGLARVVAFGLPLRDASAAVGTLVVAVLIGLGAAWAAPNLGVPLRSLVSFRAPANQLSTAVGGLLLGLVAYLVGASPLWAPGASGGRILVALAAVCAAAFTQELLFRGVVQSTLWRSAGRVGLLAGSALYAATYLGLGPAAFVMTVALAGLIFSYMVARTGSLTGAVAGHALFVLGAGGFWTVILGRRHHPWAHGTGATVGLAVLLAVTVIVTLKTTVDISKRQSSLAG